MGRSEVLQDVVDDLLGIAEQHHGVVAEEHLVLDAGIAGAHGPLDEEDCPGVFHVEDGHAVDRG